MIKIRNLTQYRPEPDLVQLRIEAAKVAPVDIITPILRQPEPILGLYGRTPEPRRPYRQTTARPRLRQERIPDAEAQEKNRRAAEIHAAMKAAADAKMQEIASRPPPLYFVPDAPADNANAQTKMNLL